MEHLPIMKLDTLKLKFYYAKPSTPNIYFLGPNLKYLSKNLRYYRLEKFNFHWRVDG